MDESTKMQAARNMQIMVASGTSKQPISLLQEVLVVCARAVPKYDLVKTEGADHVRSFTYRAYIDDVISAYGTAGSKKEAKTESARNLIKLFISYLQDAPTDAQPIQPPPPSILPSPQSNVIFNRGPSPSLGGMSSPVAAILNSPRMAVVPPENSIGALQEWLVLQKCQAPKYTEEARCGEDHMPSFTTSCTVWLNQNELKTVAVAGNKKEAKKLAAQQMWVIVVTQVTQTPSAQQQSIPVNFMKVKQEPPSSAMEVHDKIKLEEVSSTSMNISLLDACAASVSSPAPKPQKPQEPQEVYDQIQQTLDESDGPAIINLKIFGINKDTDHMTNLRDVCREQALAVNVTRVDGLTDDGMHQCMVQLRFPLMGSLRNCTYVVCCGVGADDNAAEENAARNTLQYLKMMAGPTKIVFDH